MDFREYIRESKNQFDSLLHEQLKVPPPDKISIVLGNESSDMDSFVCSITWGYFRTLYDTDNTNESKPLILPVSCTTKELFALRGDCLSVCDLVNISYERDIIFINDFQATLEKLLELRHVWKNNTPFTLLINLVDQPGLPVMIKYWLLNQQKTCSDFRFYIEGIVDHHKPDPNTDKYISKELGCYRRVQVCGSNTTNIAEAFREKEDELNEKHPTDIGIVYFILLSTILIDTKCMDLSTGKVTDHDTDNVKWLCDRIGTEQIESGARVSISIGNFINKNGDTAVNCPTLFQVIEKRKNNPPKDVNLTPELALMKDFKIYELEIPKISNNVKLYGISTVGGMSMNGLITLIKSHGNIRTEKDAIREEWKTFEKHMKDNLLDWMYIMCAYNEESVDARNDFSVLTFRREFIAIVPSKKSKTKRAAIQLFGDNFITKLKLSLNSRIKLNDCWEMWYFEQKDTAFSRKTLQPLLHEHLVTVPRKKKKSLMKKIMGWFKTRS